jgi:uncharacterized protein (DUF736 family)
MATIGSFHKQADGSYAGAIQTLMLSANKVQFRASHTDGDRGPDFRIFAGAVELGAAWKKTSREGRDYLSVKLDDPSFASPIYASLVDAPQGEHGSGYSLVWSRSRSAD